MSSVCTLWLLDPDGVPVRALTLHPAADEEPEFSPDGQWIAYQHDASDNADVWVMRADGSERTGRRELSSSTLRRSTPTRGSTCW